MSKRALPVRDGEMSEREYFNPWRSFCAQLPHMIHAAQDERLQALERSKSPRKYQDNYRNFYVATSLFAVSVEWRSEQQHVAINTMPSRWGSRVCAEKRVTERLLKQNKEGAKWEAIGAVVIGEPQEDRATHNDPGTLWPCGETCLVDVLPKLPSDMLIVTVRPDLRRAQVQTVEEMDTFYSEFMQGEQPPEPPVFDQGRDGWNRVVNAFDRLIPTNVNVLANLETRRNAVEAARMAIEHTRQIAA